MKDVDRENVGKKLATVARTYPGGCGYEWGADPLMDLIPDATEREHFTEQDLEYINLYG